MSTYREGQYNGSPTFTIIMDSGFPFAFGVGKAEAAMRHLAQIKEFAAGKVAVKDAEINGVTVTDWKRSPRSKTVIPVIAIKLAGKGKFSFGAGKAWEIIHHAHIIEAWLVEARTADEHRDNMAMQGKDVSPLWAKHGITPMDDAGIGECARCDVVFILSPGETHALCGSCRDDNHATPTDGVECARRWRLATLACFGHTIPAGDAIELPAPPVGGGAVSLDDVFGPRPPADRSKGRTTPTLTGDIVRPDGIGGSLAVRRGMVDSIAGPGYDLTDDQYAHMRRAIKAIERGIPAKNHCQQCGIKIDGETVKRSAYKGTRDCCRGCGKWITGRASKPAHYNCHNCRETIRLDLDTESIWLHGLCLDCFDDGMRDGDLLDSDSDRAFFLAVMVDELDMAA